jgi:hypothetical protein
LAQQRLKTGRPRKRTAEHIPQGVDVVMRTLMLDHMNQGRWYMMNDPDLAARLPFFLYDAILDGKTTTICLGYNGTLLPVTSKWWLDHWPPNHWGCRSIVRSVSRRTAGRRGVTVVMPRERPIGGWGLSPPARAGALDLLGAQKHDLELVLLAKRKVRKPVVVEAENPLDTLQGVATIRGAESVSEPFQKSIANALTNAGAGKLDIPDVSRLQIFSKTEDWVAAYPTQKMAEGMYQRSTAILGVRLAEKPLLNKPLNDLWNVADSARNREERIGMLVTHEYGHHIHMVSGANVDAVIKEAFSKSVKKSEFPIFGPQGAPSEYGAANEGEFWAESYVAYRYKREWFKDAKPVAFKMVEDVLALVPVK